MDDDEAASVIRESIHNELKAQYESEMLFISSLLIKNGPTNQSTIIKALQEDADLSGEITVRGLRTALKKLTDIVWTVKRGEKYALVYSLIDSNANQYQGFSRGEF